MFGVVRDDVRALATATRDRPALDLMIDGAIAIGGGASRFAGVKPVEALSEVRLSLAGLQGELGRDQKLLDHAARRNLGTKA
jgi:hypothetical protein